MLGIVETGQCPVSTIFLSVEIPQITCIYILKWLIECNEIPSATSYLSSLCVPKASLREKNSVSSAFKFWAISLLT